MLLFLFKTIFIKSMDTDVEFLIYFLLKIFYAQFFFGLGLARSEIGGFWAGSPDVLGGWVSRCAGRSCAELHPLDSV